MTENERNELIRFIESIKIDTAKDGKPSWIKPAFDMIKEVIIGKIDDICNEKEMREIELHRKSYKELQQTVTDLSLENCLLKNKVEEMKWIPVSERLPNRHQRVLCYFKYEPESPDIISENTYICSGMWMSESDKVVAWMPLPKAYEGEKMIDEKKLIEALYKFDKSKFLRKAEFEKFINEQPKVDNWIPVSERLPDNMHDVLCCYEKKVAEGIRKGESIKYCGVGFYSKFSEKWHGEVELGSNVRVIAWMPLPEAYEGEG